MPPLSKHVALELLTSDRYCDRVESRSERAALRSRLNGKLWEELSEAEHQAYPGDCQAQ